MRTILSVVLIALAGFSGDCSKRSPASPDPLPICEEAGGPPPVYRWHETPCPTAEEVAMIRQEISITFNDLPPAPVVCKSASLPEGLGYWEERLYAGLLMMRTVQIDAPLPWTNQRLWDWFRGAIRGIVVETGDYSSCCSPPKVIHLGYQSRDLASPWLWPRTPDSLEMSGVIHEARHADTGIPHTCETNHGKDSKISDRGAFGVQYLFMKLIAEHSDALPELREWSGWGAKGLRRSAFCQECSNAYAQKSGTTWTTVFGFIAPSFDAICSAEAGTVGH